MSARFDIEDIQALRTEKFLAAVLTVFLLIGGVWAYQKIDDKVADRIRLDAPVSAADEAAIERRAAAEERVGILRERARRARRDVEFTREEYRTALDERRQAPRLQREYREAQATFATTERQRRAAETQLQRVSPSAEAAERRRFAELERRQDRRELYTFLFRVLLVVPFIAMAFVLVIALHRRRSRYIPLGLGFAAFAAILTWVLAGDYLTDYIDPLDLGVLVLSLFGTAWTVFAFFLVQRYLGRRLPLRRVRRGECPFCGYPVRGNEACEGCGRDVFAPCARCSAPRRVGAPRCGTCGAA